MLELPDDFDLANTFWESLQKGSEVGAQEGEVEQKIGGETETSSEEETKREETGNEGKASGGVEYANIDSGTESKMASGSSNKEQETDSTRGSGADEIGGDGDTRESPPGGVVVHTVRPTSGDTAPSQPDRTSSSPKRRGPKFKRHRYWREHSSA